MKLAEIKEAMKFEDIRNNLRKGIEQNIKDGITVVSKTMSIDPLSFQPSVKCVIEFDYILETIQDSKSFMAESELHVIFGKAVFEKAAKIEMRQNDQ